MEEFGAQFPNIINKCNLIIWKGKIIKIDGKDKTIAKAKELNIPMVNILWFEKSILAGKIQDFD